MKRNTVLFVVIGAVALLFFIDPFRMFKRPDPYVTRPALQAEKIDPLLSYVRSNGKSPADYVVSAFSSRDIVFLGELSKIAQNPKIVASMIPALYAGGIRNLGIEFALAKSQARIDALLSAPSYDEAEAKRISLSWVVTWGYQEYLDLYRAAWEFNRTLKPGAKPFRIVGLNVFTHYEYLQTEKDAENIEVLKKILSEGVSDAYMADVIQREFTDKKEKALVYCSMQHASVRFKDTQYAKNATDKKLSETRRTAEITGERIGSRAGTVLLHGPWLDSASMVGVSYPVNGAMDALIDALPADKKTAGFSVTGTPFASLEVKSGWWATDHPSLTLGDICDGYIIMGPIADYKAVTPIKDFISKADEQYAVTNFPGAKEKDLSAEKINGYIAQETTAFEQTLRAMK